VLWNKEKINNKIEPSYIQHSMQKTLVPRSSLVECVGQVKTIWNSTMGKEQSIFSD